MKFGKYEIDKELLEMLFPDEEFIFTGEDGTKIKCGESHSHKNKRLFEEWLQKNANNN